MHSNFESVRGLLLSHYPGSSYSPRKSYWYSMPKLLSQFNTYLGANDHMEPLKEGCVYEKIVDEYLLQSKEVVVRKYDPIDFCIDRLEKLQAIKASAKKIVELKDWKKQLRM